MPPTARRGDSLVELPVAQLAPLQLLHQRDAGPGVQQPCGRACWRMPKELQQNLPWREHHVWDVKWFPAAWLGRGLAGGC